MKVIAKLVLMLMLGILFLPVGFIALMLAPFIMVFIDIFWEENRNDNSK